MNKKNTVFDNSKSPPNNHEAQVDSPLGKVDKSTTQHCPNFFMFGKRLSRSKSTPTNFKLYECFIDFFLQLIDYNSFHFLPQNMPKTVLSIITCQFCSED